MDASYCWQCQQLSLPPHPLLLRHVARFERGSVGVLLLGGRQSSDLEPPVRDADLKPCSLFIRSLSRLATPTSDAPLIRLDLSGELVTCEGAKTLAAVLQVSLSLRSLLLRRTPIGDLGALALGAALSSSALVELDLGECALTDQGLRALVRGPQVHGAPPCLSVLLLDGNATGDVGTTEVISYLERQSTLRSFSIHPSLPRGLSQEVEAALQVACELSGVTLDHKGEALSLDRLASCCGKRHEVAPSPSPVAVPVATPALPAPVPPEPLQRAPGVGWSPSSAVAERTPRKPVPDMRQSGHLASWMAGTERELRELKWLLSSSSARLDGQHRKLMSELEKLRLQLDAWTSDAVPPRTGAGEVEEMRLDVLEARFDALDQLVGREQSECAQMWQLVEVAAGSARARNN